ncbi:MAG: pyrroline-5-carboxylate reductase dimerization domain-containing protein [Nitrospiraceae bacterium]
MLDDVLTPLAHRFTPQQLIISVAAGYPVARLAQFFGQQAEVGPRAPNTPSGIKAGVTALCCSDHVDTQGQAQAVALFESIGKVSVVEERLMDAVTGLSSSGPAYVFAMIKPWPTGVS